MTGVAIVATAGAVTGAVMAVEARQERDDLLESLASP
jgi:hypothetical protein